MNRSDHERAMHRASRCTIRVRLSGLLLLVLLTLLVTVWALSLGSSDASLQTVLEALTDFDGSHAHLIITTVRLPRLLTALLVGASLATAGAIAQAVTGNPLASPGLLGINAGAAFAVVCALIGFGTPSRDAYVWFAFAGAALTALAVQAIAAFGREGATPVRLILSGAILAMFLSSLTTALLIYNADTLGAIRLWTSGSLAAPEIGAVIAIAPWSLLGLGMAVLMSGQIMTLSLGDEIARSLGQNLRLWRLLALICLVLLAGSAVALAGPIGFVGLVVPHLARLLIGVDYRWLIPFSAIGGALLVVTADSLVRYLAPQVDVPVGVTMAMLGAPFFIFLACRVSFSER